MFRDAPDWYVEEIHDLILDPDMSEQFEELSHTSPDHVRWFMGAVAEHRLRIKNE